MEVKHLLLDLASLECRLASLALAGGNPKLGADLLSRAFDLLRLRDPAARSIDARLHRRAI
jgi:hypothetical protein